MPLFSILLFVSYKVVGLNYDKRDVLVYDHNEDI